LKTSAQLRLDARLMVKRDLIRFLMTTTAFFCFSYILTVLYQALSGMQEYVMRYMEMVESGEYLKMLESGVIEPIEWPYVKPTSYAVAALCYVMTVILGYGYRGYALMRSRGANAGFRDVIPPARLMLRILAIMVMTGLAVFVGSVLFVVPGLILAYRYRLAVYVMYDNPELGAFACMKKAAKLSRGHKMRIFKLDLSFLGWEIANQFAAAFLMVPVLELWVRPYREVANAMLYNEIAGVPYTVPTPPMPEDPWGGEE